MGPKSKGLEKLTYNFQDAWYTVKKGEGYTYPSLRPRTRLVSLLA